MYRWTSTSRLRAGRVCCALALSLSVGAASAAPVFNLNGDPAVAPYYQNYAWVGTSNHNNGPFVGFSPDNGTLASSNTTYGPLSSTSSYTLNGANISATETTVPGGFFLSHNDATLSVTNANAQDGYYSLAGYGSHTTVEFFSPETLAASAVFTWHISGVESTVPAGMCDPSSDVFSICSTARLDFLATTNPNDTWNSFFQDPDNTTVFGAGTYSISIADMPLDQIINLFYWASAFVEIDPGHLTQGANVDYFADYSSTFNLLTIDLYDANGNLITDWSLVDLSTGQTVFTPEGRVPEPGTMTLLGMALGGLAFARKRRGRAH
ncbi:MAG TPA: PEP-CTERM sorting domain-containing protein [Casimicrobiaceae bacterium]|nr:PEP-CTERM sorting domain-containing protein [Casimicrobiaceae bacterium]